MKSMKASLVLALLLGGAIAIPAYQDAGQDVKDAGAKTTKAVKKGAVKTKEGAEKTATATAEGTKKATGAVKKGATKVKDKATQ